MDLKGAPLLPTRGFAGGLTRRQFLLITCLFWVYVTVSNLLYGYSITVVTCAMPARML